MTISYQFAALPSLRGLPEAVEVTRVRPESLDGRPYHVRYTIDKRTSSSDRFYVGQRDKIGEKRFLHKV